MRKIIIIIAVIFTHFFNLSSQDISSESDVPQKGDDGFQQVEGQEQWTHSFDVSDLEEGTYNIIIRGTDNTGNTSFSQPINIEIDPDSDLPIAHIANPEQDMRVGGNLNILGTCVDDDQVQYVEIKLDDGEYFKAQGTDFWSYFLDTEDMEDGYYTLTVRGTDINGVTGNEDSIGFNLDRKTPVNEVLSHSNGALVHGRVNFEGAISDKNGIENLAYSFDGEDFIPLRISYDKKQDLTTFKLTVQTKDFEDGAQILWLKSTDKMGSEGLSAFLYFVDNKAPQIIQLDPDPEEMDPNLNGIFSITGSIYDEVGVSEFKWEAADETGIIELTPGNPYWSQSFDFTGQKKARVTFTATDITGNVTEQKIELELNTEADLPVSNIRFPQAEEITSSRRVEGFIIDDDGVQSISYILDKEEPQTMETSGPYSFDLPEDISAGAHSLKIMATDINGNVGPAAEVSFTFVRKAPVISINSVIDRNGNETAYTPGMEIDPWIHQYLLGEVDFLNPSLSHSVSGPGIEEQPLIDSNKTGLQGPQPFQIDITQLPPGFINLSLKASDEYGNESSSNAFLAAANWMKVKGEDGIYLPVSDNRNYILTPENPLKGRVIAKDLSLVDIEGAESDVFSFTMNEEQFVITPRQGGIYENVKIYTESSAGLSLSSESITLINDLDPPVIQGLSSDVSGNTVTISGTIKEDAGLTFTELRVNKLIDETLPDQDIYISRKITTDEEGYFEEDFSLNDLPKGLPMAILHVEDYAGNAVLAQTEIENLSTFTPDPEGKDPSSKLVINWPVDDSSIYMNKNVQISGEALFTNDVASVSALINDQTVEAKLEDTGFILNAGDLAKGRHKITISGQDSEGNTIKSASVSFEVIPPLSPLSVASWQDGSEFDSSQTKKRSEEMQLILALDQEQGSYSNIRYKVNGGEELPAENNKEDQTLLILPENLDFMRNDVEILYQDYRGETHKRHIFFYLTDPRDVTPVENSAGFRFTHGEITESSNQIILSPSETLGGYFFGRPLESMEVISESPLPQLDRNDRNFTLSCSATGKAENVTILARTIDGSEYTFGPFSLISDDQAPVIEANADQTAYWWLQNNLPLKGSLSDDLEISRFSYRLGKDGSFQPLEWVTDEEGNRTFEKEISLSSLDDGPHLITLEAEDEAGNTSTYSFGIVKDTQAPELTQISPVTDSTVNGKIMFYIKGADDRGLAELEYSLDGETFMTPQGEDGQVIGNYLGYLMDFTDENIDISQLRFRGTDNSGNQYLLTPNFTLDSVADKPKVFIQLPLENTVVRTDFVVSGMAFDDDGIESLYWKLDDQEFQELEGSNNFEIPILLEDITDNEHTVFVKAVDLWGTESDLQSIEFMVSKAAPVSKLLSPALEETNRGIIRITGESTDANGIKEIYVSQDNGNSFSLAKGQEEWWYDLQSEYLQDGTHSLLIKAVDKTGHEGLYSTLINVDNTAPQVELAALPDGFEEPSELMLQGRAWDTISLKLLNVAITPILQESSEQPVEEGTEKDTEAVAEELPQEPRYGTAIISRDLPTDGLFRENISLEDLAPGWYNLKLTAVDYADNTTYLSRNIRRIEQAADRKVEISFPLEGENINHNLTIQGRIIAKELPDEITLFLNERRLDTLDVKSNGFFSYIVPEDMLLEGPMEILAETEFDDGEVVTSPIRNLSFSVEGPWIRIENYLAGDFLRDRPWIRGTAGYVIPQSELDELAEDNKALKELTRSKEIDYIQISLDNGKSFDDVNGKEEWKYRIETGLMQDGQIPVLLRARFQDGSTAVSKTLLIVDETPPDVALISPEEGMRFNDQIDIEGSADDIYGLDDVSVSLRKGDKSRYQVPTFIQGLYLDIHALGSTYVEVGAGLTFFDDNVKLQIAYGVAPAGQRFDGNVISAKLIANIALLPLGYFFGPSWDFYSTSFAVGANFSYFTMDGSDHGKNNTPLVLGAVLGQWEVANISTGWKGISAFSFYVEGQLWFISSDVQGGVKPMISFGLRSYFF